MFQHNPPRDDSEVQYEQAPPELKHLEAISETIVLENFRKILQADKKVLTRHPILKHLVERYDAILNDVTKYGYPKAPIEPVDMFRDRINELTVELHNKRQIKARKTRNRQSSKNQEKIIKQNGRTYFQLTARGHQRNGY